MKRTSIAALMVASAFAGAMARPIIEQRLIAPQNEFDACAHGGCGSSSSSSQNANTENQYAGRGGEGGSVDLVETATPNPGGRGGDGGAGGAGGQGSLVITLTSDEHAGVSGWQSGHGFTTPDGEVVECKTVLQPNADGYAATGATHYVDIETGISINIQNYTKVEPVQNDPRCDQR